MIKVREIDIDSFSKPKLKRSYPYIELTEFNNMLELIVKLLEPGSMQIQATYKGVTKVIGNVSDSAYNVDKLLRSGQKVRLWTTEDSFKDISEIMDYMEVI